MHRFDYACRCLDCKLMSLFTGPPPFKARNRVTIAFPGKPKEGATVRHLEFDGDQNDSKHTPRWIAAVTLDSGRKGLIACRFLTKGAKAA